MNAKKKLKTAIAIPPKWNKQTITASGAKPVIASGAKQTDLTTAQKKEWAQLLYLQNQLTQKEIAAKVHATEKTISKWVTNEHWDKLRKSLLTSKSDTLRFFYDVLDNVKKKISEDENGIGDSKMADMVVKYTSAIKSLETDTSISVLMEAGMKFHKYMQTIDPAKALEFLNNYDGFIKEQLKRF